MSSSQEFELFGASGFDIRQAGMKFEQWAIEAEHIECAEDEAVIYYNDYATYLMEEEEMDDPELTNEMYLICKYYGSCFSVWYDDREQSSVDCPEYEEWKHAQQSADEFICSEEAKCTNDDNCKGCYGTDEEEWVLNPSGKFKIKKEEKCIVPDCYEYGIIEWKAMDGNVCRECCLRINKKFEC